MSEDLFETGLEIRRAVLGRDYVDGAIAAADDFNRPMQELVTEYCWGKIWGRPGPRPPHPQLPQPRHDHGANRPHELKLHVKGAIRNGVYEGGDHARSSCRPPCIAACRRRSTASASPARRSRRWTGRAHDAADPAARRRRLHRPRQHGRADGGAPGRGRLQGDGLRRGVGGTRALCRVAGASSVADVAAAVAGVPRRRHHAPGRQGRRRRCRRRCAPHLAPGAIVVDMSSSDPVGTRALGAELARRRHPSYRRARSRAASSAPSTARSRSWSGGDAARDRCASSRSSRRWGASIFRTGPLGSGHAMKALNNYVSARRPRRRDRGAARRPKPSVSIRR